MSKREQLLEDHPDLKWARLPNCQYWQEKFEDVATKAIALVGESDFWDWYDREIPEIVSAMETYYLVKGFVESHTLTVAQPIESEA